MKAMLMEMLKQWIGGASKRHERVIHERVIHESGLFDAEWYSRRNRVNRRSAIRHFLAVGAQGGADPSPLFSTKSYLSRYPDVAAAKMNPLVHYLFHGVEEGRLAAASGFQTKPVEMTEDLWREGLIGLRNTTGGVRPARHNRH
jgi:hypothetical protein